MGFVKYGINSGNHLGISNYTLLIESLPSKGGKTCKEVLILMKIKGLDCIKIMTED